MAKNITSFFAPEGFTPEYSFDKATLKSGKSFYAPIPGMKSTFSITTKNGKKSDGDNFDP